jgi:opacity protein-like surface antigen
MAFGADRAIAQDTSKFEIAGLYTAIPELFGPTCHGAAGSVSYNMNRWLSAVGEISGCSGTGPSGFGFAGPSTTHKWFTYLAGPRVSYRRRLTPYAHMLFGGAHVSNDNDSSVIRGNAFALTIGVGVDLRLSDRFALRLFQPEYLRTNYGSEVNRADLRIQSGVVFTLK